MKKGEREGFLERPFSNREMDPVERVRRNPEKAMKKEEEREGCFVFPVLPQHEELDFQQAGIKDRLIQNPGCWRGDS